MSAPAVEEAQTVVEYCGYYTPSKIDFCIHNWELVCELAENPRAARHLLRPHRGASPVEPKIGKQRQPWLGGADWPAIVADLERAYQALPADSLERTVVQAMLFGATISGVAEGMKRRHQVVRHAFRDACIAMAVFLEGPPVDVGDGVLGS